MKLRRWFLSSLMLLGILVSISVRVSTFACCSAVPNPKETYSLTGLLAGLWKLAFRAEELTSKVEKFRLERDKEFRDREKSPLETDEILNFKGLSYFKINSKFTLQARFVRTLNEKKFNMPTSSGITKVHLKYGELKFALAGHEHTLAVYQSETLSQTEEYKNYLLIPFKDQTSGKETYGGGRYIDFEIPASEQVTLDFNLAYNPSCAYSNRFNCPIPPQENHLKVKIEAGEKRYRKRIKSKAPASSSN